MRSDFADFQNRISQCLLTVYRILLYLKMIVNKLEKKLSSEKFYEIPLSSAIISGASVRADLYRSHGPPS